MADWDGTGLLSARSIITPGSVNSIPTELIRTTPGTAAWPVAATAFLVPFRVSRTITIRMAAIIVGTTTGGNVDIGIYSANGTLLVSSGATLMGTISTVQTFNLTDTVIGPGLFYMALAQSGAVGHVHRWALGTVRGAMSGVLQAAAAGGVLPAQATMVTTTNNYIPVMAFSRMTVI